VEVTSVVITHLPDEKAEGEVIHYHVLINVNQIITGDDDIKDDLQRCLNNKEKVFVAVRYGDKMGITEPIASGLEEGRELNIKGEWITKEKAYTHGGEKMSVLHFTHKPFGFICTSEKCYQ
jgi:endonuclease G